MSTKPVATYAVASDLSGVIRTEDGFGRFPTEPDAVERLIYLLEVERASIALRLSAAKRRRRQLKEPTHGPE